MTQRAFDPVPHEDTSPQPERPTEKHGSLFGSALTDEVLDSSRSVLKKHRGGSSTVGLQQWFTPPPAARLAAEADEQPL